MVQVDRLQTLEPPRALNPHPQANLAPRRSSTARAAQGQAGPLILDLDGTLLRTDLLLEGVLVFMRSNPFRLFLIVLWLLREGRAGLKRRVAAATNLDVELLPIHEALLAYAVEAKRQGREIYVATAGDERVALAVVQRLGFVDGVIASDGKSNLKGRLKAQALKERFPEGYCYAGDCRADLPVWREASGSVLVAPSHRLERAARAIRHPDIVFPRARPTLKVYAKAIRLHQWAKNGLVFAPLLLGGHSGDLGAWGSAILGFLALGLVASANYLVNDLLDLQEDRRHWSKRERPLASGQISIRQALAVSLVLLTTGLALATALAPSALVVVCSYLVLTQAYTWRLKREPILDATALALLYTLRLALGSAVTGIPISAWLLVFSLFLFLSLSLAKRHTEIARIVEAGEDSWFGRGYVARDLPLVLGLGLASALSAVTILVLYVMDDAFTAGFYTWTAALWSFPPILFLWLSRIWLLSQRGELDDDPVAFAVRDRTSLLLGAALGTGFAAASFGGLVGL